MNLNESARAGNSKNDAMGRENPDSCADETLFSRQGAIATVRNSFREKTRFRSCARPPLHRKRKRSPATYGYVPETSCTRRTRAADMQQGLSWVNAAAQVVELMAFAALQHKWFGNPLGCIPVPPVAELS